MDATPREMVSVTRFSGDVWMMISWFEEVLLRWKSQERISFGANEATLSAILADFVRK